MSNLTELVTRARAFAAEDVDADDRAALEALCARAEGGDAEAQADLSDRFQGPLQFGTAGLRGLLGPGETRMNRTTVVRATYGLVQYLLTSVRNAPKRGIVIGRDGRHGSEQFQRDVAEVCAGFGVKVHWLPGTSPTPLCAYAVRHLDAAAGVVITASHNPPAYNGYKAYWDNGAQIVPPTDRGIAEAIAKAPPAHTIVRLDLDEAHNAGLVSRLDAQAAYLAALEGLRFDADAPVGELEVAYSAMHGVGEACLRAAFEARGLTNLHTVAEQAEPDGDFPTVEFPNPEEPGALDLVLALAEEKAADIVLVNDPDADRLGVAARGADGAFAPLSGNEIGVLLADHVMRHDAPGDADRLFVTTVVSSQLLAQMCRDRGVRYAETLTGFKWIANRALDLESQEGLRFCFGYEEALGYTVGTVVRDKDGIGAALVMAELAAGLKAKGQTLFDRLSEIRRAHGMFVSRARSVTLPGSEGAARIRAAMASLRAAGAEALAGTRKYVDLSKDPRTPSDVLVFELAEGRRACVRPSGTEPKVKLYLEVVETVADGEDDAAALARGEARLDALLAEVMAAAGLETAG